MLLNFVTPPGTALNQTLLTMTSPGWLRVSLYDNSFPGREGTTAQLNFTDGISGNPVTVPFAPAVSSGLFTCELGVYAGAGAVTLTGSVGENLWVEVEQPS
jgi:hypothetical protein